MKIIFYIKKITNFIIRYLKNDPFFFFFFIPAVFKKDYLPYGKVFFFSKNSFIKQIEEGKSVIRLGDGEMALLHGKGIGYQKYDKKLKNKLIELIKKYNSKNSNYLLGIPEFVNLTNEELKKNPLKFSIWLHLKVEFQRRFNKNEFYFDAHYFYQKDLNISFIENFILNNHIILISNISSINKFKQSKKYSNFSFKSIDFIETPSDNSFIFFDKIIYELDNLLELKYKKINKKEIKLLFSTGPTSKVLVYHYSNKNYISYDIGYGIRFLWDDKDISYKI